VLDNMRRVCDLNQLNCKVSYHCKIVVLHMLLALRVFSSFLFSKKIVIYFYFVGVGTDMGSLG
jgi:hypothetical protein